MVYNTETDLGVFTTWLREDSSIESDWGSQEIEVRTELIIRKKLRLHFAAQKQFNSFFIQVRISIALTVNGGDTSDVHPCGCYNSEHPKFLYLLI